MDEYLQNQSKLPAPDLNWQTELYRRLYTFTSQGKMIRGGLVGLTYLLHCDAGAEELASVVRLAAVLELVQTTFLVQDDIMDNDQRRRGAPTIYHQYELWAAETGLADPLHFGQAMGICFSDVALFAAYDILTQLEIPLALSRQLAALLNREFTQVALAQMQDMYYAYTRGEVTEENVYQLYLYKTARYTFSVPLMSGALLAGQPADVVRLYSELGEKLGLIFQIKDDELGLFGTEAETGKPVGSDIIEGKKTLYFLALYARATAGEKERLMALWGSAKLTMSDLEYVRALIEGHGVKRLIADRLDTLTKQAEQIIAGLKGLNPAYQPYLHELLEYNLTRKK